MASSTSLRNAALRARSMLGPESEVPPWLVAFERSGLKCAVDFQSQLRTPQCMHDCRFGVHQLTNGKAPKQLDFANDRLYQAYVDKHPEVRRSQSAHANCCCKCIFRNNVIHYDVKCPAVPPASARPELRQPLPNEVICIDPSCTDGEGLWS